MRVIVVAGGTGGHIYPAIAIINKIKEKEANSEFLYIGTTDRMEKDIIPKLGIKYVGLEMKGLNRKNVFKNINVIKCFFRAYKAALLEIDAFKPDVVVGAGGYITAPVLYAAHKKKIPVLIHEQNSVPGVSNKFIGNFADRVCVSLPKSVSLFPKGKAVYTGNPRSEEIIKVSKKSKSSLGFDETRKLVVIVMGSLGSTTMTEKIKELIPGFLGKSYQVLIVTGEKYFQEYSDLKIPDNVKVVPFMDELINILKDSDLIVSRAGASTIPAILVPSPYVTANHQYKNAKELEEAGAYKIILEEEFSFNKVIGMIDKIFDEKEEYDKMSLNSRSLGIRDSATRVYEEIRKIIG